MRSSYSGAKVETDRKFRPNPEKRLMEQVREVLRYHHYAFRTEETYCQWIKRYLLFHGGKTHPRDLGHREVERFLSHLASHERVSAATQRQALNAVVFLYRHVLDLPLEGKIAPQKARRGRRPPTVLTQQEVQQLLDQMEGTHLLMAQLLYGCGLRLMECVRLRIQDLDLGQGRLFVRGGKGNKDRTVLLPSAVQSALTRQVERARALHERDLHEGFGEIWLPPALARKYPNAAKELGWQYVFPSKARSIDPRSGREGRHHVMESGLQKAVKRASCAAGILKRVGCHTLRHSYATHLLENNTNIRVVQELMGHANVKTTEIYTHVMQKDFTAAKSPLDRLMPVP